jgi:quinol monooxygenase YgiN
MLSILRVLFPAHIAPLQHARTGEDFLTCVRANQRGTLNTEPLALQYSWGESTTVPNTFHFHEEYKGRAGFDAHTATPHFADWLKFAGV